MCIRDSYKPCRIVSTSSNRVEIGKALFSAYLDRYLDPKLPEQWRLSRYEISDGYWLGGSLKKFCVELSYDWTPLLHPLASRLTAFGGSADGAGGYQDCHIQLIVEQQADGSYEMIAQGSEGYDIGLSPRPQSETEAREG